MTADRITTPFSFKSTAFEVLEGVDLTGKNVLITGGASGIGLETTRALCRAGASVTVAVRNVETARLSLAGDQEENPQGLIEIRYLDVSDLDGVRSFCQSWTAPLHILINNAGVMAIPELTLSKQGHELQFATNYLGHLALTLGLRYRLAEAAGARVVNVSSSGHLLSPVNFDDLNFSFIPYSPWVAYGQSKTACILMAVDLTGRWAHEGIVCNALNPGAIATALQRYTGGLKTPPELRKSPQQGAATTVLLAASPLLEGIGGRYFEDCNEALAVVRRPTDFSGGVAPYALSEDNATRLGLLAEELLNV